MSTLRHTIWGEDLGWTGMGVGVGKGFTGDVSGNGNSCVQGTMVY